MSDAMSDSVGLSDAVSDRLTHSQLKKKRKAGTISADELAQLRAMEAAAQARLRHKTAEPPASPAPLTREERIALLESKLPQAGAKAGAAIARRIALLEGTERPYASHAADRRERDSQLAGIGLGPALSAFASKGLLYIEMVERLAEIENHFAYPVDTLIRYLSSSERKQFESVARKVSAMSATELERWEDQELTEHPLWTPPIRPVAIETKPVTESDKAEREKLLALLRLPKPKPVADILAPEELNSAPSSAISNEQLLQFYEYDSTL
jgi:hypothetical protein